jgi:hypothetical protein
MFAGLGVDVDAAAAGRRPLLKFCVDWSEQRHHLTGALGAAVATRFVDAGWVRRRAQAHRALHPLAGRRAGARNLPRRGQR